MSDKHENESSSYHCLSTIENAINEAPAPSEEHLSVLQNFFGRAKFDRIQWTVIRSIINDKQDSYLIAPRGFNVSLIYQYPAVFCNGLSIVISPYKTFVQNQVQALKTSGISSCALNLPISFTLDSLCSMRVIYTTPELCKTGAVINLLQTLSKKTRIAVVAVYESHLSCEISHSSYESYRILGNVRNALAASPFVAITYVSSQSVFRGVCASFNLRKPAICVTTLERRNLFFSASLISKNIFFHLGTVMLFEDKRQAIIYCNSKKKVEIVWNTLKRQGISCDFYHSGRQLKDRILAHQRFLKDDVQIIVATESFGAEIDKPDIRYIIHWGAPKNIELYYQEASQAGQDGLGAACHVFYNPQDFIKHRRFLKSQSGKPIKHLEKMCDLMEQYVTSNDCRRKFFLLLRKENIPTEIQTTDKCCDNCSAVAKAQIKQSPLIANFINKDGKYDFTEDSILYLQAVDFLPSPMRYTLAILFLRGSYSTSLKPEAFKSDLHGKGRDVSEEWWKGIYSLLIQEGFIQSNTEQKYINITEKGKQFLTKYNTMKENHSLRVHPNKEMKHLIRNGLRACCYVKSVPRNCGDKNLLYPQWTPGNWKEAFFYQSVLYLRKGLADKMDCAPFHVASGRALLDLFHIRPSRLELLAGVEGFTKVKIERDGKVWIQHIEDFVQKEKLLSELPSDVRETYISFDLHKMSLQKIKADRSLQTRTVVKHLCFAVLKGLPLDLPRAGLGLKDQKIILDVIRSPLLNSNIADLKAIKGHCPSNITGEQILLMQAFLSCKCKIIVKGPYTKLPEVPENILLPSHCKSLPSEPPLHSNRMKDKNLPTTDHEPNQALSGPSANKTNGDKEIATQSPHFEHSNAMKSTLSIEQHHEWMDHAASRRSSISQEIIAVCPQHPTRGNYAALKLQPCKSDLQPKTENQQLISGSLKRSYSMNSGTPSCVPNNSVASAEQKVSHWLHYTEAQAARKKMKLNTLFKI